MGQPRASRSRRVVESDEEDAGGQGQHVTRQSQLRAASLNHSKPGSAQSTPATTPEKPKAKNPSKKTAETRKGTGTLHTFFNAATQDQRVRSRTSVLSQDSVGVELVDDIDDGPSDTDSTVRPVKSSMQLPPRKRPSESGSSTSTISQNARKFFKAADGTRRDSNPQPAPVIEHDSRPWTERYAPRSVEELVVHKKKISDVRQWLDESLNGHRHRRLLVLKGAAGCGKTATLTALSKAMDFEILQWHNPAMMDFESSDYVSLSSQFEDFLGRGRRFGGLDIVSGDDQHIKIPTREGVNTTDGSKSQVLLIEEFPTNLQRYSAASQAFRSCILQFLHTAGNASSHLAPLVMIVSESLLSNSASSVDNFTAHRLLGPEILNHPCTATIEFNAVATTFIAKALNIVLQKRSRDTGRYYAPHADVMKKLSEFGDVRNATSTLEFLCTHAGVEGLVNEVANLSTTSRSSKVSKKDVTASSKTDRDAAMSLISLRESTIGLFHAVGKVVYNKRTDAAAALSELPEHLREHRRPLQPEVDCDLLIDETGTDTLTFLSAIHENYLPSCTPVGGNDEATLDAINGCLEALGDADLLSSREFSRGPRQASAGEELKQSDLAFQVGVRGVTFSLPHPVKRQQLIGKGRGDAFRMFYPADLKLYRAREEFRSSLETLTARAMSGTLLYGIDLSIYAKGQPISQPGRMLHSTNGSEEKERDDNDDKHIISIGSGHSATLEMLLERLPYLYKIIARSKSRPSDAVFKQMKLISTFTGIRVAQDEEDEEDSTNAFGNLPIREGSTTVSSLGFIGAATTGDDIVDNTDTALVIADDDIEDD